MGHDNMLGERIYRELKTAVLVGSLDQHLRLDFAELANEHGVSTTPVREAVMRLLGEGLVELHPKGGIRPARLSEFRLRTLLDAQSRLVRSALKGVGGPIVAGNGWTALTTNESRTRHIFEGIARKTDNPEYLEIMQRIGDRLSPFRYREDQVLGHVLEELEGLHAALADMTILQRQLRGYYRRRLAVVGKFVWIAGAPQ